MRISDIDEDQRRRQQRHAGHAHRASCVVEWVAINSESHLWISVAARRSCSNTGASVLVRWQRGLTSSSRHSHYGMLHALNRFRYFDDTTLGRRLVTQDVELPRKDQPLGDARAGDAA